MRAGDHGPDERYQKFRVTKVSSGYELDHDREFFFVMRPEANDFAARAALMVYADACESSYPGLASDIRAQLDRIERGEAMDPTRPLPTTKEGWDAEQQH